MKVNPDLLAKTPKPNGVRNNNSLSMMVLFKNAIMSAFQNTVLKVQMQNEVKLQADIKRVIQLLEQVTTAQKNLEIGKASLTTQTVADFRVNNLEKLNLENVESLAFAFEQLDPIIKSLQSSNQSDKQTIGLLTKLLGQVSQLGSVMKDVGRKKIEFPAIQKVQGNVGITSLPDTQAKVVDGLLRVEVLLKNVLARKEAKTEKKMELAEGKQILERLDRVAESLQKLPGNIEFPASVSVSNFPPQKYPLPVTNININPLRGTAKSRTITVTTTPTPLPDEVLAYRRSLVVYNNSSSTIYVGGSDVSSTNGMPVPASSYSPAFDAGPRMIIYGVTATGSANVRVLELSSDNDGSH